MSRVCKAGKRVVSTSNAVNIITFYFGTNRLKKRGHFLNMIIIFNIFPMKVICFKFGLNHFLIALQLCSKGKKGQNPKQHCNKILNVILRFFKSN